MSIEVKAPVFPESIDEGMVMSWLKQLGESVETDEKLTEIETDKVVLEVAAQAGGVLERILKNEGDTVRSGEVIAVMGNGTGAVATAKKRQPEAAPAPASPVLPPPPKPEATLTTASPPIRDDSVPMPAGISPAGRKLIQEHGIDASAIDGSGRGGRITKEDVLSHLANCATGTQPKEVIQPPPTTAALPPQPSSPPKGDLRTDRRVPMSRIRAKIAQRLVDAQQNMAILTTFNEVDMQPVMDLRNKYKEEFEKKHGVKLGFMSFFVRASVEALTRYPTVNGSIDENDIVYHDYYDIGIAVSSPRGLLVPILRDADQRTFSDIEAEIRDLGKRAQNNQIGIDELQGGTFTISNGGVFGSLMSTPILNPPQSAILGMHAMNDRPVVENGNVVIRPMMYLALSYDHRIIDGREAVLFLVTIKEMLEDPARLLLRV